jgi:protein-L-isoaspartate(D-aspartate) O-methyltransferase
MVEFKLRRQRRPKTQQAGPAEQTFVTQRDLETLRAKFADRIMERAGVGDARLKAAFAGVPREKFLGAGPWLMACGSAYQRTSSDDASEVYVDALLALDPIHAVNNGEPSAHAIWINALQLKAGDRVDHIGAGTGYYSAVLAERVGPTGFIEAYEIDPDLAARARRALADRPNVRVHAASGVDRMLEPADAIYVNAGASAPQSVWLDALNEGGRLVFPLTGAFGGGGMVRITRSSFDRWPAHVISGAAFIDLVGGRKPDEDRAATQAFLRGGASSVRWFLRDHLKSDRDWLRGDGWRFTR